MEFSPKLKRLGLLLPSSNTVQEPEFKSMLPASVTLHCARLSLSTIDPESTLNIVREIESEATKLADAEVDVVVFSATAPSTRLGKGYDGELRKRIESATKGPSMTAATAMLESFQHLGIRSVAIAAPWTDDTNMWVAKFMEANGIKVVNQLALGIRRNYDVGLLKPHSALDLGVMADRSDADAVFLACGNWSNAEVIDELESKVGKPVLTTNACAVWSCLNMMNVQDRVDSYGSLLRNRLPSKA